MFERITVIWVVVAIVGLAALYWLRRRGLSARASGRLYGPIALLVVAVGASTQFYLHWTAHPGIAANGFSSGHNVWFGIFYNLQTHPDWERRYAAKYGSEHGDDLSGTHVFSISPGIVRNGHVGILDLPIHLLWRLARSA